MPKKPNVMLPEYKVQGVLRFLRTAHFFKRHYLIVHFLVHLNVSHFNVTQNIPGGPMNTSYSFLATIWLIKQHGTCSFVLTSIKPCHFIKHSMFECGTPCF